MIKYLVTLMVSTLCILTAAAETLHLQLTLKNGSTYFVELSDEPLLTFSDDQLKITTSEAEVSYPISGLDKYNVVSMNAVNSITSDANTILINRTQTGLSINGLDMGTTICVYNINGVVVESAVSEGYSTEIDFSNKQKGAYIILIDKMSYKYIWQ